MSNYNQDWEDQWSLEEWTAFKKVRSAISSSYDDEAEGEINAVLEKRYGGHDISEDEHRVLVHFQDWLRSNSGLRTEDV